jgi:predicted helicase
MEIVKQIGERLNLYFSPERPDCSQQTEETNQFYPEDILDYIYAVLHSPKYRETYKEFLKIDFPRVPYPTDPKQFWKLVELGTQLRELHLLESEKVNDFISSYPEDGSNIVTKPAYKNGNVYINDAQYFANVPEVAWNFYIGGYQPVQKWLKDRKYRELSYEDIVHYNKMIVALTETERLMGEIDRVFGF